MRHSPNGAHFEGSENGDFGIVFKNIDADQLLKNKG